MTEQEQKAFDAMRDALTPELVRQWGELKTMFMGNGDSHEVVVITLARLRHLFDAALTVAASVSHANPETAPPPEGGAITAESAANAVSEHFRSVTEMVQPIGWYSVSRDGIATLCVDRKDAEMTAKNGNKYWPKHAPYRAVQLCEYTHPQATEPAEKEDPLQGAVDWLLQADGEFFAVATVQRTLRIGYNRAKRLADMARERAAAPEAKQ